MVPVGTVLGTAAVRQLTITAAVRLFPSGGTDQAEYCTRSPSMVAQILDGLPLG